MLANWPGKLVRVGEVRFGLGIPIPEKDLEFGVSASVSE